MAAPTGAISKAKSIDQKLNSGAGDDVGPYPMTDVNEGAKGDLTDSVQAMITTLQGDGTTPIYVAAVQGVIDRCALFFLDGSRGATNFKRDLEAVKTLIG